MPPPASSRQGGRREAPLGDGLRASQDQSQTIVVGVIASDKRKAFAEGSASDTLSFVMAGLDPAILVFVEQKNKTWMPGTRQHKAGHDDIRWKQAGLLRFALNEGVTDDTSEKSFQRR